MFTGIVTAVGRIESAAPHGDGKRLAIAAGSLGMEDVRVGDSIAVQGVCLTAVRCHEGGFDTDVSAATLAVTHGLEAGCTVNLEKSLRLADRLGGHLVAGHVDGVGTVSAVEDLGGSTRLEIDAPTDLARFIAAKGSICVDGVSLTVNAVREARFDVNVIPHTLAATTLGGLAAGSRVNLEIDMIARYVDRILAGR